MFNFCCLINEHETIHLVCFINYMSLKNKEIDKRMIHIGNRIKELRKAKGYSSAEIFAYDNDLSRVSYWRMEHGYNLTIQSLLKIIDIHHITLAEFFNDDFFKK